MSLCAVSSAQVDAEELHKLGEFLQAEKLRILPGESTVEAAIRHLQEALQDAATGRRYPPPPMKRREP